MSARNYKSRICFVPMCRTGLNRNVGETKPNLFKAPNDPKRLEQWNRAIPRVDKEICSDDVVCELHFLEDDVI
ncbi:hypothetical protein NQ315_008267 [Exocentrus adspersus]|uniref:THAP-type domain-containing protein n=1 Tax=Exocentrus adspersus TaxID=1586481 RepID=A0AAV8VNK6_9CUCU|nr:hypothetical protein NQ315_008267 [Exocentrus adspersus]